MKVRTWFRLLRRSAFEAAPTPVRIYFRAAEPGIPLSPGVDLDSLEDYRTLIARMGETPITEIEALRRDMRDAANTSRILICWPERRVVGLIDWKELAE